MSRSGLQRLMTTQQMKLQASYLAEYEQVSALVLINLFINSAFHKKINYVINHFVVISYSGNREEVLIHVIFYLLCFGKYNSLLYLQMVRQAFQ